MRERGLIEYTNNEITVNDRRAMQAIVSGAVIAIED